MRFVERIILRFATNHSNALSRILEASTFVDAYYMLLPISADSPPSPLVYESGVPPDNESLGEMHPLQCIMFTLHQTVQIAHGACLLLTMASGSGTISLRTIWVFIGLRKKYFSTTSCGKGMVLTNQQCCRRSRRYGHTPA